MVLWMPMLLHLPEDDRAFMMRLCDEYQEMIVRSARGRMPVQDAEDVLGCVMERLISHIPRLRRLSEEQLRGYVFSVTRSVIVGYYRHRAVELRHIVPMDDEEMDRMADRAAGMEEALVYREQVGQVKRACGELTPEQRMLLEMKYTQELSDEEIGQRMGLSPDAVRKRLSRVRQKLRGLLNEEE